MESFDHVKKELKIEEEGEAEKDPAFFLKTEGLSEDMKRVMAKLYTPDALKASHLLSSHLCVCCSHTYVPQCISSCCCACGIQSVTTSTHAAG